MPSITPTTIRPPLAKNEPDGVTADAIFWPIDVCESADSAAPPGSVDKKADVGSVDSGLPTAEPESVAGTEGALLKRLQASALLRRLRVAGGRPSPRETFP